MNQEIIRKIEKQITRELLLRANDSGWPCIGFDSGDGFECCTEYEKIVSECMNLDEVYLIFMSPDQKKKAWVFLVYGNDGWDLICNNSIVDGFEEMVMEYMSEYCDNLSDKMFS